MSTAAPTAPAQPLRAHMARMRDLLKELLVSGLPDGATRDNGPADSSHRLPNTLSIGIKDVSSSVLLATLSEQLAASAGAACHTSAASVSSVLKAMDVPLEYAVGTLRLSTGRHTTHTSTGTTGTAKATEPDMSEIRGAMVGLA